MFFTVVIPARFASQRLPGKPLADIAGKPMIQRVYERALQSDAAAVWVATDDQRIAEVVENFGGNCCMTRDDHPSGTDRLQEVASKLGLAEDAIVVNVQGDEPLIPPEVINQVARNLMAAEQASVSTLSEPVDDVEQVFDPNVVKVVRNAVGHAMYFSRAPIPWGREEYGAQRREALPAGLVQRHIGIYGYRVGLLNSFVAWPPSTLEKTEKLEQLRVLENGHCIHVDEACAAVPGGIDTPQDLARVVALLGGV